MSGRQRWVVWPAIVCPTDWWLVGRDEDDRLLVVPPELAERTRAEHGEPVSEDAGRAELEAAGLVW